MTDSMRTTLTVSCLVSLGTISALLGAVYAIHNTDPHHWGFILGTALDFIQGRSLFSDIYIQYGVAQLLLLKGLSYAMPINYTTIGYVTAFVYAFTLVMLFVCIEKLIATIDALAVTAIAFLLHPYAIYPWPDYLAGFCLCLSCYFMLRQMPRTSTVAAAAGGLFLFLAFLFRNTYLLNLLLAIALYLPLWLLNERARSKEAGTAILVFAALLLGYFAFLYLQGNWGYWYQQNFGAAADQYGIGLKAIVKWLHNLFYPKDLRSGIFLGLIAVNLFLIHLLLFSAKEPTIDGRVARSGILVFIALLGACGTVQCLMFYEIFRLQNAGLPLYVGFACFVALYCPKDARHLGRIGLTFSLGVLAVALLANFYSLLGGFNNSILWPIVDHPVEGSKNASVANSRRQYSTSEAKIFTGHVFPPSVKKYYEDLSKYLCDGKSRIVNLTMDATIPYLCIGQENALNLPFYDDAMLSKIRPRDAEALRRGEFAADQVIVVDSSRAFASSAGLERIGTVWRPASIRWMEARELNVFRVVTGR